MAKSDNNLMVSENFILHLTHSSENDHNADKPLTLTPNELYQAARDYIEEDHVDGVPGDSE